MTLLTTLLQNDIVKVMVLDNKSFLDYIKEPSLIIALVAIIVSLVGFIYSVRYNRKSLKQTEDYNNRLLKQTEEHNKKSVEPILGIPYEISITDKFIKIEIENCGLGTALINKFSLVYENEKFDNFEKLLSIIFNLREYDARFYKFSTIPYFVPLSTKNKLLILDFKYDDISQLTKIRSILIKTKYDIEYESLYGEKKTYTNGVI